MTNYSDTIHTHSCVIGADQSGDALSGAQGDDVGDVGGDDVNPVKGYNGHDVLVDRDGDTVDTAAVGEAQLCGARNGEVSISMWAGGWL